MKEQVVFVGQQVSPYQLHCPLEASQPPGAPPLKLAWLKDCQQLPAQEGKTYLEFANLGLEDQGNYTCVNQDNSSASFTVRLLVKGIYCLISRDMKSFLSLCCNYVVSLLVPAVDCVLGVKGPLEHLSEGVLMQEAVPGRAHEGLYCEHR